MPVQPVALEIVPAQSSSLGKTERFTRFGGRFVFFFFSIYLLVFHLLFFHLPFVFFFFFATHILEKT